MPDPGEVIQESFIKIPRWLAVKNDLISLDGIKPSEHFILIGIYFIAYESKSDWLEWNNAFKEKLAKWGGYSERRVSDLVHGLVNKGYILMEGGRYSKRIAIVDGLKERASEKKEIMSFRDEIISKGDENISSPLKDSSTKAVEPKQDEERKNDVIINKQKVKNKKQSIKPIKRSQEDLKRSVEEHRKRYPQIEPLLEMEAGLASYRKSGNIQWISLNKFYEKIKDCPVAHVMKGIAIYNNKWSGKPEPYLIAIIKNLAKEEKQIGATSKPAPKPKGIQITKDNLDKVRDAYIQYDREKNFFNKRDKKSAREYAMERYGWTQDEFIALAKAFSEKHGGPEKALEVIYFKFSQSEILKTFESARLTTFLIPSYVH